MSISGRRASRPVTGPKRPKLIAKIRRSREQAYGSDWDAISREVARRAGNRCQECKATNCRLEAHHIIPVSKGGITAFFNLRALCEKCHLRKPGHTHLK